MLGLLIDTCVLISWERERRSALEEFAEHRVYLSAITASELLHGVHRAQSVLVRERRRTFVEAILKRVPCLPFDLKEARIHAQIWAELSAAGQKVGAHDLQIAATALVHNLGLVTHNVKEFRCIPGLSVWQA